ncbi:Protein-glutamate O-methyltransferase SPCC1393.13 [Erysiphe neolycopersici]|uniref:Sugar phosphate phosphatase n=1 Tax=Erysiphe neolycopersici TaxID=212602 RepID=A0A420HF55_9PEZI|nr:Protein-glutamate O-methyltransferase SPCC1393.13 [Erysiphe neolycopersici]
MECDPAVPIYSTADKFSFAYTTARDRWPVILTGAIDDIHKAVSETVDELKREEGKKITAELAKLKYELQHDRVLTELADDGQLDNAEYNRELKAIGNPTWFNCPWLFSECYLYRRIATYFALSQYWKNFDIFAHKKTSTFHSSRSAVVELAHRYQELISQIQNKNSNSLVDNDAIEKTLFLEACEICLWGNATDLSLLAGLSCENIQKLQGTDANKSSKSRVLINDLTSAYNVLKEAKKAEKSVRQVDIVLDNAGFELYVDLILAGFLLSTGLATSIVLHAKSIPWFVSDVVPLDIEVLLNTLADPLRFFSVPADKGETDSKTSELLNQKDLDALNFLFQELSKFHVEGQLLLRANKFWTEAGSFWRLPTRAPQLFSDLKESVLVIFKGDLNYRKLTGDAKWDATTPFTKALGPLGQESGINILSLRTCKSDVIVGLKPDEDESLRNNEGGDIGERRWTWTGKWAIMSFSNGKP